MKTILSVIICLTLVSCMDTYKITTLQKNYNIVMASENSTEIIDKYPLYFNVNDIKEPFDVISINTWNPFTLWPFITTKKLFKRYLLHKAVTSIQVQNGDAAIILNENHWQVIKYK